MLKKKFAVAILGALMFSPVILPPNNFLPAPVVFAEVKTIEADGYYIMGDGLEENQGVAKERAREDAKRAASEQACIFVESISEIKNSSLTRDEIRTFSAAVLQIIESPVKIETNGDSMVFHCRIIAKVDTSSVTEKLQQDRQKLSELLRKNKEQSEQIAKLNAEMDALKKKFATASTDERAKINNEVKRNEEQFTAAQWLDKGNFYFDAEDYNKAVEYYNKAVELNPNYGTAWNNIGVAYYNLGNYNKAVEYYNKSLELNPDYDIAWNNLGLAYRRLGNYNKAVECYNKAVRLNPKYDTAWNNLGFAYDSAGNYNKAIESYNKAIEINPKYGTAWNNLGFVYYSSGDYNKAVECYNKAVESNFTNAPVWNNLGWAYRKLGNYKKALEYYNKAVELNPNDNHYKKYRDDVLAKMN